jgi:hypothetical protein
MRKARILAVVDPVAVVDLEKKAVRKSLPE